MVYLYNFRDNAANGRGTEAPSVEEVENIPEPPQEADVTYEVPAKATIDHISPNIHGGRAKWRRSTNSRELRPFPADLQAGPHI